MSLWTRLFGNPGGSGAYRRGPVNAIQDGTGGVAITTAAELDAYLKGQYSSSTAGVAINPTSAMQVAAVYACVRIISGTVANMPIDIKRRVDDRTRKDASDHPLWQVVHRRPNQWQTPSQFKRMMQANVLLRGHAEALKVTSAGRTTALLPLHPDRMEVVQLPSGRLQYKYRRSDGTIAVYTQDQIFSLVGLTLDGVNGVSPINYARNTIGESIAMENHGAAMFRNGARVSGVLTHPGTLGPEALEHLQSSLERFAQGGDQEGKNLVLEEGMQYERMAMTAEDAQWIESRKFTRTDIAMFFGVPPFMIGDTEKSTSWGAGIEQQSIGFRTYTMEDHLTTWEEAIGRDLIAEDNVYARFNRSALVRGDINTRWGAHVRALQWGVMSPNEVRELEDMNPREGGDEYYTPPNTAGGAVSDGQTSTSGQPDPNNPDQTAQGQQQQGNQP